MGAVEIVRYLSRHGRARVARIVLVAPTLPFILKTSDNPDGVEKSALDQISASWCRDYPNWIADNARPFFTPDTSAEMVQWGVSIMLRSSPKAIVDCNHAVTETDFRPELPKITVPTLILHGDADASAPVAFTGRRTAGLIPGGRLVVYEGAAHGLFITHAARFNRDVLRFVERS